MKRLPLFPIAIVLLAAVSGALVGYAGYTVLAGLVAIGLAVVGFLFPETILIASVGSIVIGQLVRIPIFGSDNSIILNDILLPALIVCWTLRRLGSGTWKFPRMSIWLPLGLTLLSMILSVLINRSSYTTNEWISGTLYLVRWIEYMALFFITLDVARQESRARWYRNLLISGAVGVAFLGFAQLYFFPDFSFMVPQGWDPHVGRLLSTWFDPNFLGGYLAMFATIVLAQALLRPTKNWKWWVIFGLLSAAEVLTFSRSGYVGYVIGVGVVAFFRSRALLFLGVLTGISVILLVPRVQERVIGIRTVDQTAQLRIVSWNNALEVITDHPYFGIGYNHYKYAQVQYGFLQDTKEHSASGSDSSLLTIWVTTGIIGAIAYLWLFAALVWESIKTWRDRTLSAEWQAFGLGVAAAMVAIFAHSQFVNGWFYPHIMQMMWMLTALSIAARQKHV